MKNTYINNFKFATIMEKDYNFNEVPRNWRFCFNGACPRNGDCLRYQAALELPADWTSGQAVFPTALNNGECRYFRSNVKVRLATGFVIKDNPQLSRMFVALRHVLTEHLGSQGTYYLYRNGGKWLTPAQQEGIRQTFRKAGYEGEVTFAEYKEDYVF